MTYSHLFVTSGEIAEYEWNQCQIMVKVRLACTAGLGNQFPPIKWKSLADLKGKQNTDSATQMNLLANRHIALSL